jgi:hypothetical protein
MSPLSFLITPLSIFLSLSTATGILVHDMRIDKATMTALAIPAVLASYQASAKLVDFSHDLHTHVERSSLNQAVSDIQGQNPRIQPRSGDDKKYVTQKNVGFGHSPFDEYLQPLT